jgi:starch phosphorylase
MSYLDKETFISNYKEKFLEMFGYEISEGNCEEKYNVLGSLVKDYISKQWSNTNKRYGTLKNKQVYYFSMEFLLGRLLGNALLNLGIRDTVKEGLEELGIDLNLLEGFEEDQGLGNGGLGRLAACFLDSMASIGIAGHGCGIRYRYGFFEQKIVENCQVEIPDYWLKSGNVWETKKEAKTEIVKFGGEIKTEFINGRVVFNHINYEPVKAVPYDTPIIGYENDVVNNLRLWNAEPMYYEFDYMHFNRGEYLKALEYRASVESISQILYPEDSFYEGKVLRLKQQYFFVSAGLQSLLRSYKKNGGKITKIHEKVAIHINDTHPALAIPELMRLLLDEEKLGWDESWNITTQIMGYTNHTILSEALEKWPVDMMKKLLPRVYMIIEEINKRFCEDIKVKYFEQWDKLNKLEIIHDGYVRMANLAIVGSHSVNGVAKLHTEILEKQEMKDFYLHFPDKFNNKTNGITHRRWLMKCNPGLTNLLKETIGDDFIKNPEWMKSFARFADEKVVQERLHKIKRQNKINLISYVRDNQGIDLNPDSIFDVQVKRIHAYKRQLLNCLRIMDLYNALIENPNLDIVPRTFIFGGKAAPGYHLAKKTIELINVVGNKINNDKRVKDKIKVVYLENYRVSLAETIIPATDLSEQISTTTKEASGTSNMKFMMNGAITIATLDGANVEIAEKVGTDNIVIFGLTEKEVLKYYTYGGYNSTEVCNSNPRLKRVLDSLINGEYSQYAERFKEIHDHLILFNDEFFTLKDFSSYIKAQEDVDTIYRDMNRWQKMAGINIANSGDFSSDRTISEYAREIWRV